MPGHSTILRPMMARNRFQLTQCLQRSSVRRLAAVHAPERNSMPPGYKAVVGNLRTFTLPEQVTGSSNDKALGKSLIDTWRKDGILQISMDPINRKLADAAFACSKRFFFNTPYEQKTSLVDDQSFAGYIASGEEITGNIRDYSEIFTVTKDLPLTDLRVQQRWPCHGPCPWPHRQMKTVMQAYMDYLGESGEKMLQLIALGLGQDGHALTKYTQDGWHHMRILRFPPRDKTNGKGKDGRGIGSHTDYGLLVIAAQDNVGGLFVRPPIEGESFANWKESAAGLKEEDEGWVYVPPVPDVFTVFPGDMMQYITNSYLPSTPHKVGLNTRDRFAFAYFHEPNFSAVMKPLKGFDVGQEPREGIHYGTHFTNMFMRNYPERVTAHRMMAENRMQLLNSPGLRWPDTPNVTSSVPDSMIIPELSNFPLRTSITV